MPESPPNGIHFLLGELKGGLSALKETVEVSSRRSAEHHTKVFERVDNLTERIGAVEHQVKHMSEVAETVEKVKDRLDKITTERRVDTAKRVGVIAGVALTFSLIGNAAYQKTAAAATAIFQKLFG